MNSEAAYGVWAPEGGPWSPWVKPILFASQPVWTDVADPALDVIPAPAWLAAIDTTTAFVIDLPGAQSLPWAIALARRGWKPVPLYNALPGESFAVSGSAADLVDVAAIVRAMRRATVLLAPLTLAADGPPAFLLDAQRRYGTGTPAQPGRFDNRSISLPTDFPSGVFLRSRGIQQVVLIQASSSAPQADLAHTLVAWQEAGIPILVQSASAEGEPQPVRVARPSRFRALWYRCLATLGLRRHPLGGFGGIIAASSG